MRRWAWPTMGSYASLAVPDAATDGQEAAAELAVRRERRWFDTVEAALSPYRADSDLCRWREGELALDDASPLLLEVMTDVAELTRITRGGFNPTDRLKRFDPSGYVKGWSIQHSVRSLLAAGFADVCLGVGGDLQMVGHSQGGRPWRAAVVDPAGPRRVLAVVEQPDDGRAFAVATSGSAERGDHIWGGLGPQRPHWDSEGLAAVTVVGPDLGRVDAFATAIWALAKDQPLELAWSWLAGTGCEALAVTSSGDVRTTPGMGAHLVRAAA